MHSLPTREPRQVEEKKRQRHEVVKEMLQNEKLIRTSYTSTYLDSPAGFPGKNTGLKPGSALEMGVPGIPRTQWRMTPPYHTKAY
jgi:hypothetical protein